MAKTCGCLDSHAQDVRKISVLIFDQLSALHGMGECERLWLEAAAILHDIGWVRGQKKHHKTSQRMIIGSKELLLPWNERKIIGLIARYHRKSLPKNSHPYYSSLNSAGKRTVNMLASFLRLADGLDRSHSGSVRDLSVIVYPRQIHLRVKCGKFLKEDRLTARKKSDLFKLTFGRKLIFFSR